MAVTLESIEAISQVFKGMKDSRRTTDGMIHMRRERIEELNQSLHELNLRYPGVRRMPKAQRGPEYLQYSLNRMDLLTERRVLSSQQTSTRLELKGK